MPPNQAPSSSVRWPSALLGLLVAAAVAWWVLPMLRHTEPPPAKPGASVSTPPRARRSAARVEVAAKRRAGASGHVLDADRKPIAAASVCAWALPGRGLVTAQTRDSRCAITDSAGAYALTDLFPATPLAVSASAPGFAPRGYRAPGGGDVRLAEGEQRAGVDFVLRPGVLIEGSVSDVTGGGVGGALVMCEDGADRTVTTSDGKGEFKLWVEPGPAHVSATAAGYAPGWASGPAPGHVFKIHLVPGSTLVGRAVLAGDETPVAGVMIEGIQVEGGGARASARTDEEGRFRIEGLMPGRYRIEATSEGREGYSGSSITLGMGETSSEVRVELEPAYVVRGRVVDKATGEPCQGGQVTITDRKQNEYSQTTIEPDGWARMASVIPGTYSVVVNCKDHLDRDDYPVVAVKDRDAPPLTWEVERGASVRVEVVDGQGRPVRKANVNAFATGPEGSTGQADHVEADGTFLVSGLKNGSYSVSVQAGEGGRGSKEVTVAVGREEHLKIELPPSGVIEGIVEDEAHRPVPNVQLVANGPSHAAARSLDDGTFSLTGLSSGEYEVRERSPRRFDPDKPDAHVVKVTVTAPDRVRVTVTVESHAGTIEGHVTDGAGKPVTDAFIDFAFSTGSSGVSRYTDPGRAPVITDTEGHFTVEGLADGEYNLRAYRKGGGEANVDQVKVGTRDVTLKLGEGGSITGMLTAGGAPVERFTLSVRDTKTSFYRGELFFHAKGVFDVHDLPAGTYEISAETPDGTTTAEVTLADGEQKTGVAMALSLRGDIDGRVVDERGVPIAGAQLSVDGSSRVALMTGEERNNKSGPDGRFHLEGVLAGQWSLRASRPDSIADSVTVPVEVREGGGVTNVGEVRFLPPPAVLEPER